MRKTLVYDLPTRLFHGLFATLFLISFVIGKTVDDESLAFSYHMLSGFMLGALVVWRLVWGLIGSEHARFFNFDLNPVHLLEYLKGMISGSRRRWAGHNPASSWAAITMLGLGLGLAITGYLMSTGQKEQFEDIHELFANTFIVIVGLHIAGVVFHSIRHQDGIALSMVDGKKEILEPQASISSSRRLAAIVLLALMMGFAGTLYKGFDAQTRTLHLFGQTLQLGENEGNEHGDGVENGNESSESADQDNDDD